MTTDRSNAMTLGALGMLSGSVAWALINFADVVGLRFEWIHFHDPVEFAAVTLYPGLVFGLVIGFVLNRRGKVQGLRQVGYLAAATLAYFCAIHVAIHFAIHVAKIFFPPPHNDVASSVISGIAAGLVGSLLLGLMTMLLLRAPGRLVLQRPVLVGGAVGALLGLIPLEHNDWCWSCLALFVLWQGAYAASLAPLLRQAK
jgi:hypothetical protein